MVKVEEDTNRSVSKKSQSDVTDKVKELKSKYAQQKIKQLQRISNKLTDLPVSSFNEESSKKSSHRLNADIMQHLLCLEPGQEANQSFGPNSLHKKASMRKLSQTQTRYYNLRSTT